LAMCLSVKKGNSAKGYEHVESAGFNEHK